MIIEPHTLALFVPACFAMNRTIGPNNLMVMNNGARHGPRLAATAMIGRLAGQAILITASAAGLATLLLGSSFLSGIVKTVGALWLLWIAWGGIHGGAGQPQGDPDLHRLPAAVRRCLAPGRRPARAGRHRAAADARRVGRYGARAHLTRTPFRPPRRTFTPTTSTALMDRGLDTSLRKRASPKWA